MRPCVVVPTYNEEGNIRDLINRLLALSQKLKIIIVDGHSTDKTGYVADLMAHQYPQVEVIHQAGKLGLGAAYTDGFRRALLEGCDCILTMDADFSHDPAFIPNLLEQIKKNDVVIGSRYIEGGGIRHWGILRRILSWGANTIARLMLGFETADNTSGFRCYRADVLKTVNFETIKSDGYSYLLELLYRCKQKNFRVKEVPIIFTDRRWGCTKISKREIIKAIKTLVRLFFIYHLNMEC